MELKVSELTKNNKKAFNRKDFKSPKHSFQEVLQTAGAFSSSFDPLEHISDKGLKVVNKLEKIFDIKITNSNFKQDGYLDIMNIIKYSGNNVSSKEVKELEEALVMGVNENLISLKDAEKVLNWLKARVMSFKIKDDELKEILKEIDKIQNNEEFIEDKEDNKI